MSAVERLTEVDVGCRPERPSEADERCRLGCLQRRCSGGESEYAYPSGVVFVDAIRQATGHAVQEGGPGFLRGHLIGRSSSLRQSHQRLTNQLTHIGILPCLLVAVVVTHALARCHVAECIVDGSLVDPNARRHPSPRSLFEGCEGLTRSTRRP